MRPHSTFTAKSNSHLPKGLALQLGRQSKKTTQMVYTRSFCRVKKGMRLLWGGQENSLFRRK